MKYISKWQKMKVIFNTGFGLENDPRTKRHLIAKFAAFRVISIKFTMDGFAWSTFRELSHPTLAPPANMGYNKTPYEAEILA
jgi:hypothetical protein